MSERKTLQLRDPSDTADAAPAIKKKGRGWEISEKRLDALHDRAREVRRDSSEAHKALAKRFADYMGSKPARAVMTHYGFVLPGEAINK